MLELQISMTNAPASRLSAPQARTLLWVRWQIELIWKFGPLTQQELFHIMCRSMKGCTINPRKKHPNTSQRLFAASGCLMPIPRPFKAGRNGRSLVEHGCRF